MHKSIIKSFNSPWGPLLHKCEQVQFCENSDFSTWFLVTLIFSSLFLISDMTRALMRLHDWNGEKKSTSVNRNQIYCKVHGLVFFVYGTAQNFRTQSATVVIGTRPEQFFWPCRYLSHGTLTVTGMCRIFGDVSQHAPRAIIENFRRVGTATAE